MLNRRSKAHVPIDVETLADIAAIAFDLNMELNHPVPCHVMKRQLTERLNARIEKLTQEQRVWLGRRAGRWS